MMDGRLKYVRILRMINQVDEKIVHAEKLKTLIRINIAGTEKIVLETLRFMVETGMVREVEPFQYAIIKNGKVQ